MCVCVCVWGGGGGGEGWEGGCMTVYLTLLSLTPNSATTDLLSVEVKVFAGTRMIPTAFCFICIASDGSPFANQLLAEG